MSTSTILNIKTDKRLKTAAQETAKELGVPLSTAVNAFLRQFVRDRELTLSASLKPSPYLEGILEEAEADDRAGRTVGPFKTIEALVKSLES
jgi:addiction module RelB/DinJ family antitoxin